MHKGSSPCTLPSVDRPSRPPSPERKGPRVPQSRPWSHRPPSRFLRCIGGLGSPRAQSTPCSEGGSRNRPTPGVPAPCIPAVGFPIHRRGSEEGRGGEEGRTRWVPGHLKKKIK